MSMTLRDEDRRALDLLLDRTSTAAYGKADGNGGAGAVFAGQSGSVAVERIEAAEKVLRMLDLVPAGDPSQDLVGRTLERVEQAASGITPVRSVLVDMQRPVA